MRILIVDDSKAMRMIVKRQLTQIDDLPELETGEAASGVEGLAWISEHGEPDVILCDWNMPEMNGIDFLRELRADGCEVPFGFVTSESQPAMKDEATAAGAQFFVTKPFTADTFKAVLADAITL
jgi:two-component system chemotaxis response regulator CheY